MLVSTFEHPLVGKFLCTVVHWTCFLDTCTWLHYFNKVHLIQNVLNLLIYTFQPAKGVVLGFDSISCKGSFYSKVSLSSERRLTVHMNICNHSSGRRRKTSENEKEEERERERDISTQDGRWHG